MDLPRYVESLTAIHDRGLHIRLIHDRGLTSHFRLIHNRGVHIRGRLITRQGVCTSGLRTRIKDKGGGEGLVEGKFVTMGDRFYNRFKRRFQRRF